MDVDYARQRIRTVPITRVVVASLNLDTGFVWIAYDAPEHLIPHGSQLNYYRYYVNQVESIAGITLEPYDIHPALMKLEKSELVRLTYGRSLTPDGIVDLISESDYRKMGVYDDVRKDVVAKERGRYIWLCPASMAEEQAQRHADVPLLRDVPTEIYGRSNLIRFTRDCVEEEVEYVLGQIRDHA